MRQASVGFQCPSCVAGGAQKVYTRRSMPGSATPVVATTLIAMNVAVYVVALAIGGGSGSGLPRSVSADWAMGGSLFGGTRGVAAGEWYRLVTGSFLHADLGHLAGNMLGIYFLGRILEPVLGKWRFGLVFVGSFLAGSLGILLLTPYVPSVGASDSVFGLYAYALIASRVRRGTIDRGLTTVVVLLVVFTFFTPGVSIGGHLGGLVGGGILGLANEVVADRFGLSSERRTLLLAAIGAVFFAAGLALATAL